MAQIQNQIKTKTQFIESEKTEYTIEYDINNEYNSIVRLRLEMKYLPLYPYGNYVSRVWIIDYRESPLRISSYVVRNSWNGTGRDDLLDMVVDLHASEDPWFLDVDELEDMIESKGVKETMKTILETLVDFITDPLKFEDCE